MVALLLSISSVANGFITNSEGRIYVDALNLNVGGDFTFSESANDLYLEGK